MTIDKPSDRVMTPAVARAVAILELLSAVREPQRLSDIASELELPLSSVSNLCTTLEAESLLVRNGLGFRLGPRIVELAHGYLDAMDPVASFAEAVAETSTLRHHTAQMGMLDGGEVLYVARRDGDQPFRISSAVGKRLPVSCTAIGKAALSLVDNPLALLPPTLPSLTSRSLVDHAAFELDLHAVADRGYAIDDQETSDGIMCFAIAVAPNEGPVMGMSATILVASHTEALEVELVGDLKSVMRKLWPAGSRSI